MSDRVQTAFPAFEVVGRNRPGPWLITCDHASNVIPPTVRAGDLGISPIEMGRHIAYDIGAAGVTRALSRLLNAPAILCSFSRLIIDPNRGEHDPTLLMQLSDGTVIEGNRGIDSAERQRRLNLFYRPYHAEISALAEASSDPFVYLAIHSFAPSLHFGPRRPWEIGVLFSNEDERFALPLIERLEEEPDIRVGRNEPYSGALDGDSVDRHARRFGRPNALIELRHDLIETDEAQCAWAARLAPILKDALKRSGIL